MSPLKFVLAALLIVPLSLTACSKKNDTANSQDAPASHENQTAPAQETVSAEQQAAIDALDKPVMDEKNTDIPESASSKPAEVATESGHVE